MGEFVTEARRIVAAYELRGAQGVEVILRNLAGQARMEVLALPDDRRAAVGDVLTFLEEQFADQRPLSALLAALTDRVQRPGESVRSFSNALLHLARTVRAKDAALAPDLLLRERFVFGVSDAALRNHLEDWVLDNEAATFEEVRQRAFKRARDRDEPTVVVQQQMAAKDEELSALKKQIASMTEAMTSMQTTIQALSTSREAGPSRQPGPPRQPARHYQRPRGHAGPRFFRGACFTCQEYGHRAADCNQRSEGNCRPLS